MISDINFGQKAKNQCFCLWLSFLTKINEASWNLDGLLYFFTQNTMIFLTFFRIMFNSRVLVVNSCWIVYLKMIWKIISFLWKEILKIAENCKCIFSPQKLTPTFPYVSFRNLETFSLELSCFLQNYTKYFLIEILLTNCFLLLH